MTLLQVGAPVPLLAGRILGPDSVTEGWVRTEGGRIAEVGEGAPDGKPDATGWVVPPPVNAHTHAADAFLRDVPGKPRDVPGLVGPGGWKHQQLARATPEQMAAGIRRYAGEMAAIGTARFVDFREGGVAGVRLLKELDTEPQAVVLGRPRRPAFDEEEAAALLAAADGIGLSARRDFANPRDVERLAQACHEEGKAFALHVSEAVREDMDAVLALEPTFLVHGVQATRTDLDAAAHAGVPLVVCPRSNAYHGLKVPVQRMRDAGVRLAVGTDNGMLCDGNMLRELAQLKAWEPALRDEDLLRMACHNGREVAGLPPHRWKRGEPADLVVLPDRWLPPHEDARPGLRLGANA